MTFAIVKISPPEDNGNTDPTQREEEFLLKANSFLKQSKTPILNTYPNWRLDLIQDCPILSSLVLAATDLKYTYSVHVPLSARYALVSFAPIDEVDANLNKWKSTIRKANSHQQNSSNKISTNQNYWICDLNTDLQLFSALVVSADNIGLSYTVDLLADEPLSITRSFSHNYDSIYDNNPVYPD